MLIASLRISVEIMERIPQRVLEKGIFFVIFVKIYANFLKLTTLFFLAWQFFFWLDDDRCTSLQNIKGIV